MLPAQRLFGHGRLGSSDHGLLQRYYYQFRFRSIAISLAKPTRVALLTRPDVYLISNWKFQKAPGHTFGWSLSITNSSGHSSSAFELRKNSVVVPMSSIYPHLLDDVIVAGSFEAVSLYIELFDRLKVGEYYNATILRYPYDVPEDLLQHHLQATGLELSWCCWRRHLTKPATNHTKATS